MSNEMGLSGTITLDDDPALAALANVDAAAEQTAASFTEMGEEGSAALARLIAGLGGLADASETAASAMTKISLSSSRLASSTASLEMASGRAKNMTEAFGNTAAIITLVGAGAMTSAASLDYMLAKTAANAGLNNAQLGQMREAVLKLGTETGQSFDGLAAGYMKIHNFGFEGADAINVLTEANKSAIATGADVAGTAEVLAKALHEYSMSASQAGEAMNVMHLASQRGNMTLEQFDQAMGPAIGTAANLGVSLADVSAAEAALTQHGFDAAEAATQLKAILDHMIVSTPQTQKSLEALSKASGVDLVSDFSKAGLQAKGLHGVFEDLGRALNLTRSQTEVLANAQSRGLIAEMAKMNPASEEYKHDLDLMNAATGGHAEKIMQLIPAMRGGLGAMILLGTGAKDYADDLGVLNDAYSGKIDPTTRDYNRTMATTAQQFRVLGNQIEAELIPAGEKLLPVLHDMMPVFKDLADDAVALLNDFAGMPRPIQEAVLGFGALRLGSMALGLSFNGPISKIDTLLGLLPKLRALSMGGGALAGVGEAGAAAEGVGAAAGAASLGALAVAAAPVAVGVGAAALAIWGLVEAEKAVEGPAAKTDAELQAQRDSAVAVAYAHRSHAESVMALIRQYENLSANLGDSKQKHEQLQAIMNQIAQEEPDLVKGYRSNGDAIVYIGNAADQTAAKLRDMAAAALTAAKAQIAQQMQTTADTTADQETDRQRKIWSLKSGLAPDTDDKGGFSWTRADDTRANEQNPYYRQDQNPWHSAGFDYMFSGSTAQNVLPQFHKMTAAERLQDMQAVQNNPDPDATEKAKLGVLDKQYQALIHPSVTPKPKPTPTQHTGDNSGGINSGDAPGKAAKDGKEGKQAAGTESIVEAMRQEREAIGALNMPVPEILGKLVDHSKAVEIAAKLMSGEITNANMAQRAFIVALAEADDRLTAGKSAITGYDSTIKDLRKTQALGADATDAQKLAYDYHREGLLQLIPVTAVMTAAERRDVEAQNAHIEAVNKRITADRDSILNLTRENAFTSILTAARDKLAMSTMSLSRAEDVQAAGGIVAYNALTAAQRATLRSTDAQVDQADRVKSAYSSSLGVLDDYIRKAQEAQEAARGPRSFSQQAETQIATVQQSPRYDPNDQATQAKIAAARAAARALDNQTAIDDIHKWGSAWNDTLSELTSKMAGTYSAGDSAFDSWKRENLDGLASVKAALGDNYDAWEKSVKATFEQTAALQKAQSGVDDYRKSVADLQHQLAIDSATGFAKFQLEHQSYNADTGAYGSPTGVTTQQQKKLFTSEQNIQDLQTLSGMVTSELSDAMNTAFTKGTKGFWLNFEVGMDKALEGWALKLAASNFEAEMMKMTSRMAGIHTPSSTGAGAATAAQGNAAVAQLHQQEISSTTALTAQNKSLQATIAQLVLKMSGATGNVPGIPAVAAQGNSPAQGQQQSTAATQNLGATMGRVAAQNATLATAMTHNHAAQVVANQAMQMLNGSNVLQRVATVTQTGTQTAGNATQLGNTAALIALTAAVAANTVVQGASDAMLGFAGGGTFDGSQPFWVGEEGPEIMYPESGGRVLSHNDSMAAIRGRGNGGGGGQQVVNNHYSMTVHTKDAPSFRQSQRQIQADHRRAGGG